MQLFAESGFRGTTTKAIANAAGVSEGTLFLYYPTKEQLYHAILQDKTDSQVPMLAELARGKRRPLDEMLTVVATMILRRYEEDRSLLRLLLYSALEDHALATEFYRRQMDGPFHELTVLLEESGVAGVAGELGAEMAVRTFLGMLLFEILTRELFADLPPARPIEEVAAGIVSIFLRGIERTEDNGAPAAGQSI